MKFEKELIECMYPTEKFYYGPSVFLTFVTMLISLVAIFYSFYLDKFYISGLAFISFVIFTSIFCYFTGTVDENEEWFTLKQNFIYRINGQETNYNKFISEKEIFDAQNKSVNDFLKSLKL